MERSRLTSTLMTFMSARGKRPDAVFFAGHQQYAQRQADHIGKEGGQYGGVNGLPDGAAQPGLKIGQLLAHSGAAEQSAEKFIHDSSFTSSMVILGCFLI